MSRGPHRGEIDTIENVAETKGIEVDDVEVIEDDDSQAITFRIYETKAETEEDSVGIDVTKPMNAEGGPSDVRFRDRVQRAMSSLKKYLSDEEVEEVEAELESDEDDESGADRTREQVDRRPATGDGPGAQLDARMTAIENRLDDVEERLDALEDKSEALDGLQQLMEGDTDE